MHHNYCWPRPNHYQVKISMTLEINAMTEEEAQKYVEDELKRFGKVEIKKVKEIND